MSNEKWKWFNIFVKVFCLIWSFCVIVLTFDWFFGIDIFSADIGGYDSAYHYLPWNCNVWVVKLRGDLYPYLIDDDLDYNWNSIYDEVSSENIRQWIEFFSNDDQIDMILLDVDSFWWSPYWAEEVMNALLRSDKDSVALIHENWLSAAYYSTLWADKIIASKMSNVWSIWATASYLNYSEQNKENWIKFEELATGKFKNSWSPDKDLTDEERELFMRDLKIVHDYFVSDVAKYRNLDIEKVMELADWSSMLWEQALKEGLIDEIWDLDTIKKEFFDKYGYEANFCVY